MASHAPAACCTVGKLHKGNPLGTLVRIDDTVDAYLAVPSPKSTPSQAVLFLPDIIGISQNSKFMADAFASQGYTCLVLDLFNGDPAPLNMPDNFDIMRWLSEGLDGRNPHMPETIDPIVVSAIGFLKSRGINQIAAAGYCLGAKYVIRHYQDGVQCGFIAHPSFVESEELAAVTGPLSIAAAELDDIFPADKRHESEAILARIKQDYQDNLFSGVHHGFAIWGGLEDEKQQFAKEQAFHQALCWFKRYFDSN